MKNLTIVVESDDVIVMLVRKDMGDEVFTINGHQLFHVLRPHIELLESTTRVSFELPKPRRARPPLPTPGPHSRGEGPIEP